MVIQPDWSAIVGLVIVMVLGLAVGPIVRRVLKHVVLKSPSPEIAVQWDELANMKTGGSWIGHIERPMFYIALWIPGLWPILSSWLVFKLAFYWQSANFVAFPDRSPDVREADYLVAKRLLGSNHVATSLVGTGANILVALIGVAIGRTIHFG